MKSLIFIIFLFGYSIADNLSFEGYVLIRAVPKTTEQLALISAWSQSEDFDVWNSVKGLNRNIDVALSPTAFSKYKSLFEKANLSYKIVQNNIQNQINEQKLTKQSSKASTKIVGTFARYEQIQTFINDTVAQNPTIASSYIAGQSYEKRNLHVIVLKTATSKRSIWIDCGIHAREWISPSTCIWIINKLVSEYKSKVATTVALLNYFEVHILPVMNPDGYDYTFTTDRLWRKNRRPNPGSQCVGTDLNRNSGHFWMTGGSSSNPCSDVYAGPSANSELEIKAVQKSLNAKLGNWDAYLTLHTYGLWWFTTWGYTSTLPSDYKDLVAKAQVATAAIKRVNGSSFVIGSSTRLLGAASGGSEDWAKGVAKIKYSYCLELRPGNMDKDASYGFLLPADRIPLAGEETYQGIKAFMAAIRI